MAALLAYMEFQFEACLQALFQTYITYFNFRGIRNASTNQVISLYQSYATIIITVSNVWIPQLIGTRQYVPTIKTKVWQFSLNTMLFFSLLNTLYFRTYNDVYFEFVVLLYAGMCSTLLLHNNVCKKFKHTNRLKSCLLTFLFLIKLVFGSLQLSIYLKYNTLDFNLMGIFYVILPNITICMDAFFAYTIGKSALKSYSLSSIWNLDPTIISKPLLCTGYFLASLNIVDVLSYLIIIFMYKLN